MHHQAHRQRKLSRSIYKLDQSNIAQKLWLVGLAFLGGMSTALAEEADKDTSYLPLFQYGYLSLGEHVLHSPGLGLAVVNPDLKWVGLYSRHELAEPLKFDTPSVFHSLELALDWRADRHNYLAFFSSASDRPVSGGLNTYMAGALYGYEVFQSESLSLTLGGGLAVGDFGLETSSGATWPVIPVPMIRLKYDSELLEASVDFMGSPTVSAVVGPNNRLKVIGDLGINSLDDVRDIQFDLSLAYRLFRDDHPMGDIAGVSLGVKNDGYAFDLGDEQGSYQLDYLASYISLDASVVTLTGGYAHSGREHYDEDTAQALGDGFFVSLQGVYPFL